MVCSLGLATKRAPIAQLSSTFEVQLCQWIDDTEGSKSNGGALIHWDTPARYAHKPMYEAAIVKEREPAQHVTAELLNDRQRYATASTTGTGGNLNTANMFRLHAGASSTCRGYMGAHPCFFQEALQGISREFHDDDRWHRSIRLIHCHTVVRDDAIVPQEGPLTVSKK